MRKLIGIMCGVVILVSGCGLSYQTAAPERDASAETLDIFTPVKPERWTLPNGLTVVFLRDDELPLVRGRLFLRAGSLWADAYPIGTTSAMGEGLRLGGAGALSADALDKELERLAAGIGSSFSTEFGTVSFSCLSSDVDRVFSLFSDVVLRPRFAADRLALWKGQSLEGIRRRVEDPSTVASIAFTQIAYKDTQYGKVSRARDISAISRADVVRLHKEFVRPDGAILVVTGKIDRQEVESLAARYLGEWKPRGAGMPAPPPISHEPKPGIYFVTLPFAQATVKMGHLGVPRFTPDYPEIDVFNEVFGTSGFGSRLMKRVRTELGLSYGVSGGIVPGVVRGTNYVFLQTKAESVGAAIGEAMQVLDGLRSGVPGEDELSEKKEAIANSYVFNFGSKDAIAERLARQELLQYPADFDATYLPKIQAVSPEQVVGIARNRWDPGDFVIVVVGNEAAFRSLEQERAREASPLRGFDLVKLDFNEALVMH